MTKCACKTRYYRDRCKFCNRRLYYKKGFVNSNNRKHNPLDGSGSMYDESGGYLITRGNAYYNRYIN